MSGVAGKIGRPRSGCQLAIGLSRLVVHTGRVRDGDGRVFASLNVNTHAAETPVEVLMGEYLPLLLQTAGAISADWAACHAAPQVTVASGR